MLFGKSKEGNKCVNSSDQQIIQHKLGTDGQFYTGKQSFNAISGKEIILLMNVWVPEVGNTTDTPNPLGLLPYYHRV